MKLNNIIIFSADRPNNPVNLVDPRFKPVIGSYKGSIERSYLTSVDNQGDVIALAKAFKQESILFVVNNEAFLLMLADNLKIKLGSALVHVDRPTNDAFTIIDNMFYEVR